MGVKMEEQIKTVYLSLCEEEEQERRGSLKVGRCFPFADLGIPLN